MLQHLFIGMRPKQWTKNAVIYAALIFDEQLFLPHRFARTTLTFVLFCLASSAVYLINDIVDLEQDKFHPSKRLRPLPSGQLPISWALVASSLLLAGSILPAFLVLGLEVGVAISAYFLLMVLYSFVLKQAVILDVLTIAAGFNLRVLAGVLTIPVQRFSPWLYVCTTLLALFLGLGKRRSELSLLNESAGRHRPILQEYTTQLLDEMILVVTSVTLMAYSLYTFSAPNLPKNHAMMLTVPLVIYGLFSYLYLIRVKGEGGNPENILLTDVPLMIDIVLWLVTAVIILYLF